MTIQEVLKSGKPFKRADNEEWVIYDPVMNNGWFYYSDDIFWGSTSLDLYYEDLVAEDWEIKNE